MKTLVLLLAAASASAGQVAPQAPARDSGWNALSQLQQISGPTGAAPSDPSVPRGKAVVADPKKDRPKFKLEPMKARQLFEELTRESVYDQRQVLWDFPVRGMADAENQSGLSYPVFSIHIDHRRYPVAYAFYLLGDDEIERMMTMGGGDMIPTRRLMAFAAHGSRYKYVLKNHPDLASHYEDEMLDGVITEPELIRLPTTEFNMRAAIDYIADTYILRSAHEAENEAKKKPWYVKKGITAEQVAMMESAYEFSAMKDLDEDGKLDLIHYYSVGDTLEERRHHKPDGDYGHKWNYFRMGQFVSDGHKEHAEAFHVRTGDGSTFCARDLIGGWWHEPFTADFGGSITFVKDPEACGLQARTALLFRGKGEAGKVVLTHGQAHQKTGVTKFFKVLVQERRDVDSATADCLQARPDASVISTAAVKGTAKPRRTLAKSVEAEIKAKAEAAKK